MFSCAPVVTRAVVIFIFHWMLLRSVRVSRFPPQHTGSSMVNFTTAQQDIPRLHHSKYNTTSQGDETFSGKGVIRGKTLDYYKLLVLLCIFPNTGKKKQVFYFLFQQEKCVNCSWGEELKTALTWGTAAEPNNLRNAEK